MNGYCHYSRDSFHPQGYAAETFCLLVLFGDFSQKSGSFLGNIPGGAGMRACLQAESGPAGIFCRKKMESSLDRREVGWYSKKQKQATSTYADERSRRDRAPGAAPKEHCRTLSGIRDWMGTKSGKRRGGPLRSAPTGQPPPHLRQCGISQVKQQRRAGGLAAPCFFIPFFVIFQILYQEGKL